MIRRTVHRYRYRKYDKQYQFEKYCQDFALYRYTVPTLQLQSSKVTLQRNLSHRYLLIKVQKQSAFMASIAECKRIITIDI